MSPFHYWHPKNLQFLIFSTAELLKETREILRPALGRNVQFSLLCYKQYDKCIAQIKYVVETFPALPSVVIYQFNNLKQDVQPASYIYFTVINTTDLEYLKSSIIVELKGEKKENFYFKQDYHQQKRTSSSHLDSCLVFFFSFFDAM